MQGQHNGQDRIDVDRPRDLRLTGARTLVVGGAQGTIVLRTDVEETFDHCHLAAEIAVDGRRFFGRAWDLDLRRSEWSVKESGGAASQEGA